jgi:hypothetical protein
MLCISKSITTCLPNDVKLFWTLYQKVTLFQTSIFPVGKLLKDTEPLPSLPTPCCHPMALVAEPPAVAPAPHQQLYSLTRSSAWQEVLQMWCRFQNRAVETMLAMMVMEAVW